MAHENVSGVSDMRRLVEKAVGKGWHVVGMTEMAMKGEAPELMYSDAASEEPGNVMMMTFLLPHGDHFHFYHITLIRPELNTTTTGLTDKLLVSFRAMEMDEMANVVGHGQA